MSTKETGPRPTASYAFPNPTTICHVPYMGSGQFKMVDGQGRVVGEAEHKDGDATEVSALPYGVYTYTLVTKGSRTKGRMVREQR